MSKIDLSLELFGRTFADDMAEISGFGRDPEEGRSYEMACRAMVLAGVEWLSQHPGAKVKVGEFMHVAGVTLNLNVYAEQLEQAMLEAPFEGTTVGKHDNGVTGAMVQFSKRHTLRAAEIGWDAYCRESRVARAKEILNEKKSKKEREEE